MINLSTAPYAAPILRLSLGVMFLAHGALKIFVFTIPGFVGYFGSLRLPPNLAYGVIALELLGGATLIFGIYASWVAPRAGNVGHDRAGARCQRLAVHEQGRRLGIPSVLSNRSRSAVSAR